MTNRFFSDFNLSQSVIFHELTSYRYRNQDPWTSKTGKTCCPNTNVVMENLTINEV